ncbi:mycofactocin system glycosyltransferase [Streptomyces sp. YC537]|uniref:Mycofactocin system glycosyltransferase n=2 Tax=Streptomyces boluensis TaxID=1775135 RepID=A0A964XK54_9ACTN|nr:mycofactocin system glycosyltransferase [Streptomyces boluensis]
MRLPADFQIVLDPGVRRLDEGRVLLGGSPLRMVRLRTASAVRELACLERGEAVGAGARSVLARRLLDAGLAQPRPGHGEPAAGGGLTVVIPVRDRPVALRRCLAALARDPACDEVLVVDDASERPELTAKAAAQYGARVLRRDRQGGPAAARNTGLRRCRTPLVAFVDSDCVPGPGWLDALLPHFRDPAVAAVAPRITGLPGPGGPLVAYEACRSSLDLGPAEGRVAPGTRISYVPSAALLVRREAAGGGFDEELDVGEDVDFVWRVHRAGWTVRYEPGATVAHDHRVRFGPWLGRRFAYGTSAAPLALRHPGDVPPVAVSVWSAAAWVLLAAGRPAAALALTTGTSVLLSRKLAVEKGALPAAARLAGLGTLYAGRNLASGMTRAWWPVSAALAVRSRPVRRALIAAVVGQAVDDWVRLRPGLDPVRFLAARTLDDAAYGAGLWWGALRSGSVQALLPDLSSRPRSRTKRHPARTKRLSEAPSAEPRRGG